MTGTDRLSHYEMVVAGESAVTAIVVHGRAIATHPF